ncbi:hypothetical protein CN527_21030 [Bacillus cereus]|nr:hypothetical protein CN527_21030 [Bacillus cereus]
MHVFYKIDTNIQTNRTLVKPFEVQININYLNEEFKERIKNVVENYRPAFKIRPKNFILRWLQKDKFKIKLISYSNEAYRSVMTGDDSCLYNLNYFDFQSGYFSFSERNEAEEVMYKIKEIIRETLNTEALLFHQHGNKI